MSQGNNNTKILNNLYSRQIGTIGKESMDNLMKKKILILGMRGNGIEIAKNTVLSGVNRVTIYDPNPVLIRDLCSNFYLEEKDKDKRRDESVLKKLKDLNPYTYVDILQIKEEESLEEYLSKLDFKYNVIVQTEFISEEKLIKLSDYCHSNNICFIYGAVFGLNGFIFNDFGEKFTIYDIDGREPKRYHIKTISKDEKCIITLEEEKDGFGEDDLIIFKAVEGMTELNTLKDPVRILEVKKDENDKKSFVLDLNTTNFSNYKAGGLIYKYKEPIDKHFKSFKESSNIPFVRKEKEEYFTVNEESEEYLYNERYYLSLILAIGKYLNNNKDLPELRLIEQAQEITNIAKDLFTKMKEHDDEMNIKYDEDYQEEDIKKFDEKLVTNIFKLCRAEIAPVCSIVGSIISLEILKSIGKYEPIEQWKFFDFSYIKPPEEKEIIMIDDPNTRYLEQIAIFGKEFQEKIKNFELFIIGSGAIGCEVLKNFAMMGVSTNEGKTSMITDCDTIEMSNLNRQFLFRKEDIGKSKSLIACKEIKKMNPEFNCISSEKKVAKETEDTFNEQFWKNKDYIICGLDNVKARNYVNKMCHKYNKSFIDAGTNGTKGRITVVVPFDTTPLEFTETNTKNFAMCTLKNFPTQIEHCIEWSKMNFLEIFYQNIIHFKDFINISTEEYIKQLNELAKKDFVEKVKTLESNMNLMNQENDEKILEKIIYRIIVYFDEFYNLKIKELLKINPPDKKNEEGKPFWNAIKRAPQTIEEIDMNDKLIKTFIISFIHIYSKCLGIEKVEINEEKIIEIIKEFKKNQSNINEEDIDTEDDNKFNKYKEEKIAEIKKFKEIIKNNISRYEKIKEEIFEKDGLDNYHMEFIESSSNLRAKNYFIEPADTNKTLMIAGNIIQALPTTTSAVSGYLALQLISLVYNEKQNANMDLSCNMFYNYSPSKYVPKPKPEPIKINESMTSQQFIDYFKEIYKYDVYSYYIEDKNCYTRKIFKEFEKKKPRYKTYMEKLGKTIEENYNSNLPDDKKKKNFVITIYAHKLNNNEDDSIGSEDTEDELPLVLYNPYSNKDNINPSSNQDNINTSSNQDNINTSSIKENINPNQDNINTSSIKENINPSQDNINTSSIKENINPNKDNNNTSSNQDNINASSIKENINPNKDNINTSSNQDNIKISSIEENFKISSIQENNNTSSNKKNSRPTLRRTNSFYVLKNKVKSFFSFFTSIGKKKNNK